ncbi:MAG: 23S rRNA (pseudouridine(1915)-N(3))-methyltransferase RlmH [Prevotella sp.]|nr:23S rRNA (pseudouridine(1915)-N(3))-methyltransferase RlmH [Prevotella sp.]
MKVLLLLVGKTTNKHISACIDDYVGRIGHYLPFSIQVTGELKNTKNLSVSMQKEREGEQIIKYFQAGDHVVLLDEHGEERRSVEFASWLEHKQMVVRRLVFVIGGPYGFSDAVYARCDERVSLSLMTFSHQMVRLVFVEQIYRACTIIRGEPYHHE